MPGSESSERALSRSVKHGPHQIHVRFIDIRPNVIAAKDNVITRKESKAVARQLIAPADRSRAASANANIPYRR